MTSSHDEPKVAEYIQTLRRCLAGLSAAERDDVAKEIRMHVRERLASNPMLSVDEVLRRLGSPQTLARQYQSTQLLERASRSYSPLLMLRATLRWALTGIQGFLIFDIAVIGYALGAGFILLALAKPLFPDMIGLWMAPGLFEFGFRPGDVTLSHAHELLGDYFVPVTLGLGTLFMLGTTRLLRFILARFGKLRLRLSSNTAHAVIA